MSKRRASAGKFGGALDRHRKQCRVCEIIRRRGADSRGPCDVARFLAERAGRAREVAR